MGVLTVKRWHQYGKRRLYVSDEAGARVGWYDFATGDMTLERDDLADEFEEALLPHLPTTIEDLADRRPGEAVRQKADEEWEAQKASSRLKAYADRLRGAHTEERAWRRGAEGEEVIGNDLERLRSSGWHVLHSVPVGQHNADIDHVVIGPGGVFTINTKNHLGKRVNVTTQGVWVSGQRKFYIRNSVHEAERASRLLTEACGIPVTARGIVVIRAQEFRRKAQPHEIWVFNRKELAKWLKNRPQILDAPVIAAIYAQARRGEIWISR